MRFVAKDFKELTASEVYEILKARAEIFVVEQGINYQDMDDIDYKSRHCFLEENGKTVAYLTAFYEDENKDVVHIGRVLSLQHNIGLGRLLMEYSMTDIKKHFKCSRIRLNSQKQAVGFYEKIGFKTVSLEFLIEDIVHLTMELDL